MKRRFTLNLAMTIGWLVLCVANVFLAVATMSFTDAMIAGLTFLLAGYAYADHRRAPVPVYDGLIPAPGGALSAENHTAGVPATPDSPDAADRATDYSRIHDYATTGDDE